MSLNKYIIITELTISEKRNITSYGIIMQVNDQTFHFDYETTDKGVAQWMKKRIVFALTQIVKENERRRGE